MQVMVRDNNVDQALRVLKKKMQREGLFREMKQRRAYEKPSERKTREKSEAIRRARKPANRRSGKVCSQRRRRRSSPNTSHLCRRPPGRWADTTCSLETYEAEAMLSVCFGSDGRRAIGRERPIGADVDVGARGHRGDPLLFRHQGRHWSLSR